MAYAKALGAQKAEVLSHQTSGDVTGDKSSVVGYAAVTIKK
jgi:AmmeMemoRadiSam system protein B